MENGFPALSVLPDDAGKWPADALVAGGFASLDSDSSIPLSPTLQLNGDLCNLSIEVLTRIALAEEERKVRGRVQSYTLKVEPRAAVIADNAQTLSEFLHTWGGVMETLPLLVSENQQAGFTVVSAVDITSGQQGGCLVLARGRSPVDADRCTRCGRCGQVCPEGCIDPWLNIDFTGCTFCGECSAACSHDAIDIYAVSETVIECPAVILAGEPPVSVDDACKEIIFDAHTGMVDFFRTVGSYEIEERISVNTATCQYISRIDTGCTRCVNQCTANALGVDSNGIHVDHMKCTDCGKCVAACPTGALQYEAFSDASFVNWFERAGIEPGLCLVLGSEEALLRLHWYQGHRNFPRAVFLEHPSVSSLTMMHFLFLFGIGFQNVILLDDKNPGADSSAWLEADAASQVISGLFDVSDFIQIHSPSALFELPETCGRGRPAKFYDDFSFSSRRQKLVSILKFLRDNSDAGETAFSGPGFSTFGTLELDTERCSACLACLNACVTGALDSDVDNFRIVHEPWKCVQCGACVTMCPEHALHLRPGLILDDAFFQASILMETSPVICRACGARFGTQESYSHVVSVLQSKGAPAEMVEVLQYCETCRARRIFEKGAG